MKMFKKNLILIVDNVKADRAALSGMVSGRYRSIEAENGAQAMQLMGQYRDSIAAVLLELSLPVMDGYQVMRKMRRRGLLCEMPVIVTVDDSIDAEAEAFNAGASDVITKPFDEHTVRRCVQNVMELNQKKQLQDKLAEEQNGRLRKFNAGIIAALASIIETRNLETGLHVKRISTYVKVLMENLATNYPEYMLDAHCIDIITNTASLHDIGKIAIPDAVLNKPGKLTDEEYAVMKTHTIRGCEILDSLIGIADHEYLQCAYNICRYHHERWDGHGYPDGLRGDEIPISAQCVGIADCYDVLTTDRVYKKAIPPEEAITLILNGECGAFSPKLLTSLKAVRYEYISLAAAYADSSKAPPERSRPVGTVPCTIVRCQGIQPCDTQKYYALLNYIKSTVMEADFSTGIYHMVYQCSSDFDLLKSGGSFAESMRRFTEGAVHPDDREKVLEILSTYQDRFFSEGLMQAQRNYRIYNRASGKYLTYQATMIRVSHDEPDQQCVLLIWSRLEEPQPSPGRKSMAEEMILQNMIVDVQQLRNDKWLTMPAVSRGLMSLLGYDSQEIRERFCNRYIELIHPDDRETVLRKNVQQQRAGSYQEMEYRVIGKNGSVFWLLDKSQLMVDTDGQEYFFSLLIDVTRSKAAEEEFRALAERYRIIQEQTNDVIWEWRAADDALTFSPSWRRHFGYGESETGIMRGHGYARHIHKDDVQTLEVLLDCFRNGERYGECEVRVADADGNYRWCRFHITVLRGQDGEVTRSVGLITDIDSDKKALQKLRSIAEHDSLTVLYNKQVAKQKIDEYISHMQPGESGAMFVIDVDDFKRINDHYGHMLGDTVLQKIASELEGVFRSQDIVARIGGDEFLVFMTSVHGKKIVEECAVRINSILQNVIIQTIPDHTISCSIGLALCPTGGRGFDELFIHGDLALYDAKRRGKNRHSFYRPEMENADFEVSADTIIADMEM